MGKKNSMEKLIKEMMAEGSGVYDPWWYESIRIKRVEKDLPLPEYKTSGACGMDLYSRIDYTFQPGEVKIIPSNIAMEVPSGYALWITPRSSLPLKTTLEIGNSPGLVDSDFTNEIGIICRNIGSEPFSIARGDRLANMTLVPIARMKFDEVDELTDGGHAGFGSTGK